MSWTSSEAVGFLFWKFVFWDLEEIEFFNSIVVALGLSLVGKRDQNKEFQKLVTFGEPRLTHNGQIGRALDRDGISFGRDSKPLLSICTSNFKRKRDGTTERYIAKGALVHGP